MEGIKGLFESLKEFIWDVIGYFIPGIYLIILLSVIVEPTYFIHTELIDKKDPAINFVVVVIAYILGYLIYGFGEWKEKRRGPKSFMEKIQANMPNSISYKLAAELLQVKISATTATIQVSTMTAKEVRNLAMSYAPDADKKVYTFMFRSDLARHIANTSLVVGLVATVLQIAHWIHPPLQVVKGDEVYVALYAFLICCFYILNYTRDRFYRIAMNIPFSILISTLAK
jgi:Flp pilus assembly protein TadB